MIPSSVAKSFFRYAFHHSPEGVLFSHGRLEIIGNHTDHNHGLCLVAGCDIGITSAYAKSARNVFCLRSKGYPKIEVSLDDLSPMPEEKSTSAGIVRGVLRGLKERGYCVGGLNATMVSDIPSGSGVSSSACFESLVVGLESLVYNEGKVPAIEMAKIGQFAENVYFGKPSGLLDQVGTSFGGIDFLDFGDMDHVVVDPMSFALPLDVTLVITPSSHAALTDMYASIPSEMKGVAKLFGKEVLREVPEDSFAKADRSSSGLSPRAWARAEHFFAENRRVLSAKEAIEKGDVPAFLAAISASQASSKEKLENTMVPDHYANSPQEAVDLASAHIGKGAVRIMGGGFAGSIIAFTFHEETAAFRAAMAAHYGARSVLSVAILDGGPRVL